MDEIEVTLSQSDISFDIDIDAGTGPIGLYRELEISNGLLRHNTTTSHLLDFTGVTDIDQYLLYEAYSNNNGISGNVNMKDIIQLSKSYCCYKTFSNCFGLAGTVDLSNLETISGYCACQQMFFGCNRITKVKLQKLKTVSGYNSCSSMFYNTGITELDLPLLETISDATLNSICYGCGNLIRVNMTKLKTAGYNALYRAFMNCENLEIVILSALESVKGVSVCQEMCSGCIKLKELSFPALKTTSFGSNDSQFRDMCKNIPEITIHFPSNIQEQVSRLIGYNGIFGAISGEILFDLPATE